MPDERKLAAIVFSDIVGFTELMNSDEKAAMDLLKKQRTLLRPIIENFDGEWLKEMGDGILTSFPSAVKAATCALEIQRILEHDSKLTIRIGIHIGDIIIKDGDVFGDGVNIASRMEQLAEPGGICISERVHDDIRNKPEINAVFQDEQILKGIAKPIKVYSIFTQMGSVPNKNKESSNSSSKTNKSSITNALLAVLILLFIGGISYFFVSSKSPSSVSSNQYSDSNSIAVLPFSNFSKNPDDQYFSDGLTEVIIANLSKVRTLKVISRTSVMQFKNSTKSLKEIGKELGVAYILEGSVQKGSNRIRIVGQLIDTQTDDNIWAETYDSELTDLFDIQINVAKNIAEVIKGELSNEEIDFLSIKTTENVEAWDYYLKAKELMSKSYSKPNMELSISLLNKAIKADSKFVEAYSMLTRIHLGLYWNGVDRTEEEKQLQKIF